jgi:tRNA threonylcarbamoyladenosine biosynthesis protein TsaE
MSRTFRSHSETETRELGRTLALALAPGTVVLLVGDLGAGKTSFVKGLAAGLGIDPDTVSSPTFTLVHAYRGRLTLYHVDLYRLEGVEPEELGLEELAAGEAVVAIEWAEKLTRPFPKTVQVFMVDAGGETRDVTIE